MFFYFIVDFWRVNMFWEDYLVKKNYDFVSVGSFWDLRICRDKKENRFWVNIRLRNKVVN